MKVIKVILLFCILISCKRKFDKSDLSFFCLKGKVEKFSTIIIAGNIPAESVNFKEVSKTGNYLTLDFDTSGTITFINTNYTIDDLFKPKPNPERIRDENTLLIEMSTSKEKYWNKFQFNGDTITFTAYNKLDLPELDYHSESIKKFKRTKIGNWIGFTSGINESKMDEFQYYFPVKNQQGLDSIIYVYDKKNSKIDTSRYYSVKYYSFDEKGNWTLKQTINNSVYNGYGGGHTMTEVRQFNYYE